MSFDHEDVLQILALLDASGFDELRLETADYKLHLRRSAPGPHEPPVVHAAPVVALAAPVVAHVAPAVDARDLIAVTAPLLGTFYASPQPGAPPFVQIGASVDADTVIGIVEVMKLMNSVPAGASGIVAEIVARDGSLVEYGEVLMRIARAET